MQYRINRGILSKAISNDMYQIHSINIEIPQKKNPDSLPDTNRIEVFKNKTKAMSLEM